MKILVVEDDMVLAEEICKLLEKWGFQGEYLEDFSAVDKEWAKRRAQLMLMDINLPYYDGFYWCSRLRTKIFEETGGIECIRTRKGKGYYLE